MSREALESELNNAEYYLAESEMEYDRTNDEDAGEAVRFWFNDVNRIKEELGEAQR